MNINAEYKYNSGNIHNDRNDRNIKKINYNKKNDNIDVSQLELFLHTWYLDGWFKSSPLEIQISIYGSKLRLGP